MIQILKKYRMFVVREFLNNNQDATNIYKSETKKKGRRTGASPADLSRHRFGDSRSDLPPLFNFKSFIMRESMVECCDTCATKAALSAEQIINILNYGASVTDVRKHLRAMMDAWFLYHEPTPEEKDAVYATWYTVDKAMEAIAVLSERRAAL